MSETLFRTYPQNDYGTLVHFSISIGSANTDLHPVFDGLGNQLPIQISTVEAQIADTLFNNSLVYLKATNTPSNPDAGKIAIYVKADKHIYILDEDGLETDITSNGGTSVPTARTVTALSPLTGGGDLSANISIGIDETALSLSYTQIVGLGTLATQNGTFSGTHSGTTSGSHSGTSSGVNTGDQDLSSYAQTTNVLLKNDNLASLASAATSRNNLGLGTLATQNGTFSGTHSGNSSGTNTGDQSLAGYALTSSLATVATTGAYSDLSGTPVIPTQYTNEMVDDRVYSLIQPGTGISWSYDDPGNTLTPTVTLAPFSTTDLAEGSSLYYTAARFNSAFGAKTTDNLSEGSTNLYFTNERVDDRVNALWVNGTYISKSYNDGANTFTVDLSATGTPDNTKFLRGDNVWAVPAGGGGGSGVSDGDYGDVAVSGSNTIWTVESFNDGTPFGTMAGETAADYSLTSAFDNVAFTGAYSDLSGTPTLGTLASQNGTFSGTHSGNSSGTNTGDQNLSGYALTSSISAVGLSGAYADLIGEPVIGVDTQAYDVMLDYISTLVDPNADRLMFWDDSAGSIAFLTLGTNLTITGTTINASGGGSATVTEYEVDFGSSAVAEAVFSITDAAVSASSKIIAQISGKLATGRDTDDAWLENFDMVAVPGSGTFDLYMAPKEGIVTGKYYINYMVG